MRIILFLLSLVFITHYSLAQKKKEVVVKPGKDIAKSIPISDRYRFKNFQEGTLILGKEVSESPRLNFEFVVNAPQFINDNGDTLVLDKNFAKYIQIGKTIYVNTESGYYELISFDENLKLAIVREWNMARYESTINVSPAGVTEKAIGRRDKHLVYSPEAGGMVVNEDTVFKRDSSYFFIDTKENIYKVSKKNLFRMYPHLEDQLKRYIDQERTDFKKEEDLLKLSAFCVSLLAK